MWVVAVVDVAFGFRRDEDEDEGTFVKGVGLGAANLVSSFAMFGLLGCLIGPGRVGADDAGLEAMSIPASCWVTDRTDAMMKYAPRDEEEKVEEQMAGRGLAGVNPRHGSFRTRPARVCLLLSF